ncbi:hypothetical protein N7520_009387 [Penicillium odoratum]|uniref:uncharacterized protein n=1 Tax=Penicillium odoratum TaxID=1167516 RepID=UPI002546C2A8|nr:uncharacterized protein N7520_009387 [Penicillium odoratum]KAJ5752470.1 hypothetical protein N7520_009387 [Penicillium odoratum]
MSLDLTLQSRLSIGAPVDSKALSTAEEDQAELKNYDMKIYQKSMKMAEDLKAELRALRIPFFVLKDSLVQDSSPANLDGALGGGSKLSKAELMNLQRRMLELLEVRCED